MLFHLFGDVARVTCVCQQRRSGDLNIGFATEHTIRCHQCRKRVVKTKGMRQVSWRTARAPEATTADGSIGVATVIGSGGIAGQSVQAETDTISLNLTKTQPKETL